jgi:hypothetical protein
MGAHTEPDLQSAPARPVGHVLVPQFPEAQFTVHPHELLQSIVPHALAALQVTVHSSAPHVMSPHAPELVHWMLHR